MLASKILFWYAFALVIAWLEIEIEGKFGWAEKLPTWVDTTSPAGKVYAALMGGKPLTGYHLNIQVLTLMAIFAPYAHGMELTLVNVILSIALYFAWAPLWDFLWFVMNPHYGVKKFKKNAVWWFSKSPWILGLFPMDYVNGVGISFLLAGLASYLAGDSAILINHSIMIASWIAFVFVSIAASPFYRRWRIKMNTKDDRNTLDIFHR